jgi:nucleotidyltransferase substrate binding protein (TIGR01987 family)
MEQDIRWEQRFTNYKKALGKLTEAVNYIKNKEIDKIVTSHALDEIIKEGLIQRFEYTHELAWNVMKDYAWYQGINISGSRDATREAFKLQLFTNGHVWMDMISRRNETSHTYNEETADIVFNKIITQYYPEFIAFAENMERRLSSNQSKLFL